MKPVEDCPQGPLPNSSLGITITNLALFLSEACRYCILTGRTPSTCLQCQLARKDIERLERLECERETGQSDQVTVQVEGAAAQKRKPKARGNKWKCRKQSKNPKQVARRVELDDEHGRGDDDGVSSEPEIVLVERREPSRDPTTTLKPGQIYYSNQSEDFLFASVKEEFEQRASVVFKGDYYVQLVQRSQGTTTPLSWDELKKVCLDVVQRVEESSGYRFR